MVKIGIHFSDVNQRYHLLELLEKLKIVDIQAHVSMMSWMSQLSLDLEDIKGTVRWFGETDEEFRARLKKI